MRVRYWTVLGFFVIVGALPAQSYAATAAAPKLSCEDTAEMASLTHRSWYDPDYRASFEVFRSRPEVAACYLINELRVVPESWIRGGDQSKHPETMHVIWSLRALRYITGGLRFKGKTKYRFNESS